MALSSSCSCWFPIAVVQAAGSAASGRTGKSRGSKRKAAAGSDGEDQEADTAVAAGDDSEDSDREVGGQARTLCLLCLCSTREASKAGLM